MHLPMARLAAALALTMACAEDRPAAAPDGEVTGTPDVSDATDSADSANVGDAPAEVTDVTADAEDTQTSDAVPDLGPDTSPPSAGDFDREHVLDIAITLAPADWAALRAEKRALFDLIGPSCMAGPAADVFNYYPGDVTIDGRTVERAGVRKKGFLGSLDASRPALRLELDEFVDGQELDGLERLTLNNGRQDPSRLKQCLAYDLFRAAGVPAPRCAFAHVTVNGEDLGLYLHIETIKKPFLREHFGEPLGALWEGQLSDFREGWLATFEAKLDDEDPAPLEAVAVALEAPDEGLLEALDAVIDLEGFITFWAVETLVAHWDGYAGNTNNFYVYAPADGRLRFLPWGVDGTFVDLEQAGGTPGALANSALTHRLYTHPEGRARYEAALRRLLDTVWDEVGLIDRLARWDALTFDHREAGSGEAGSTAVAELKRFVATRRGQVLAALDAPPEGFPGPLRGPPCTQPNGTVVSNFETTWNTLEIENLFTTGSGTFELESGGLPDLTFAQVGAKAGTPLDAAPGAAQIIIAAQVVGAGFIVVVLDHDAPLAPGVYDVGAAPQAILYYLDPGGAASLLGLLAGTLTLTEASDVPGEPLEGTLDTTIYALF